MGTLLEEVVMLRSSFVIRNKDREHDSSFEATRAESIELEMVRAQNQNIKLKKLLVEFDN